MVTEIKHWSFIRLRFLRDISALLEVIIIIGRLTDKIIFLYNIVTCKENCIDLYRVISKNKYIITAHSTIQR